MNTGYLNCPSGIAGDMLIAACIDAGVPLRRLETDLKRSLKVRQWKFECSTAGEHGGGQRIVVKGGERTFDSPREMKKILLASSFAPAAKKKMVSAFASIAEAESAVHGIPISKIHFHEMNALDTIVDIAGVCRALELLGIEKLYCSPINIGRAAPAAIEIIKKLGIPVWSDATDTELATPTGIALAASLADGFCPMPVLEISRSGRGFGQAKVPGRVNALQLFIGKSTQITKGVCNDSVILIETNIDDMDPRIYPYVIDKLFEAGALDAWLTSIMMKKGRPGTEISVICHEKQERSVVNILFNETTTLGVRRTPLQRWILPRASSAGEKHAFLPDGSKKTSQEYRIAARKALRSSKPLRSFL